MRNAALACEASCIPYQLQALWLYESGIILFYIFCLSYHQILQNGFIVKADRDIAFQEHRRRLRSAKGGMRVEFTRKLPHERKLSVEDVVGTFIVLGSGVIFGKQI
jgi:hypothetical protein